MTITFENDNHVIVYGLEKIISYARDNQYIFLAQSVWSISSILGLQQELVTYIDNLKIRANIGRYEGSNTLRDILEQSGNDSALSHTHPDRIARLLESDSQHTTAKHRPSETSEYNVHNTILDNCEESLKQSEFESNQVARKNLQISQRLKRQLKHQQSKKTFCTQTRGTN
jgi:hypothetical protein